MPIKKMAEKMNEINKRYIVENCKNKNKNPISSVQMNMSENQNSKNFDEVQCQLVQKNIINKTAKISMLKFPEKELNEKLSKEFHLQLIQFILIKKHE